MKWFLVSLAIFAGGERDRDEIPMRSYQHCKAVAAKMNREQFEFYHVAFCVLRPYDVPT